MLCKICHKNETDNTSGICWACIHKYAVCYTHTITKPKHKKNSAWTGTTIPTWIFNLPRVRNKVKDLGDIVKKVKINICK